MPKQETSMQKKLMKGLLGDESQSIPFRFVAGIYKFFVLLPTVYISLHALFASLGWGTGFFTMLEKTGSHWLASGVLNNFAAGWILVPALILLSILLYKFTPEWLKRDFARKTNPDLIIAAALSGTLAFALFVHGMGWSGFGAILAKGSATAGLYLSPFPLIPAALVGYLVFKAMDMLAHRLNIEGKKRKLMTIGPAIAAAFITMQVLPASLAGIGTALLPILPVIAIAAAVYTVTGLIARRWMFDKTPSPDNSSSPRRTPLRILFQGGLTLAALTVGVIFFPITVPALLIAAIATIVVGTFSMLGLVVYSHKNPFERLEDPKIADQQEADKKEAEQLGGASTQYRSAASSEAALPDLAAPPSGRPPASRAGASRRRPQAAGAGVLPPTYTATSKTEGSDGELPRRYGLGFSDDDGQ